MQTAWRCGEVCCTLGGTDARQPARIWGRIGSAVPTWVTTSQIVSPSTSGTTLESNNSVGAAAFPLSNKSWTAAVLKGTGFSFASTSSSGLLHRGGSTQALPGNCRRPAPTPPRAHTQHKILDEHSCQSPRARKLTLPSDDFVGKLQRDQELLHFQEVLPKKTDDFMHRSAAHHPPTSIHRNGEAQLHTCAQPNTCTARPTDSTPPTITIPIPRNLWCAAHSEAPKASYRGVSVQLHQRTFKDDARPSCL